MTARVLVRSDTLKGVLHLPRQVLFEKDGRPVVYVRDGGAFKPQPVNVVRVTENRVVLKDLPPDAEVALINPESLDRRGQGTSRRPPDMPGAGR
jgi:hypothetical protein